MAVSQSALKTVEKTLEQLANDLAALDGNVRILGIRLPWGTAHGWQIETYEQHAGGFGLVTGLTLYDVYIELAHKLAGTEPPPASWK